MPHTDAQLKALIAACEQFRGAEAPGGYRDGLALCVIDSVQSTGVNYASVGKVLDRYRAYRREQGGEPATDGTAELLASFDECSGPDPCASRIGTRNRTSTRGGILTADAARGEGVQIRTRQRSRTRRSSVRSTPWPHTAEPGLDAVLRFQETRGLPEDLERLHPALGTAHRTPLRPCAR